MGFLVRITLIKGLIVTFNVLGEVLLPTVLASAALYS